MVSKSLVDVLSTALSIRKSYVLHVILEWYDETMVPKFEQIVGESGLSIEEISAFEIKGTQKIKNARWRNPFLRIFIFILV